MTAWVPLLRTYTGSAKVVVETIEGGLTVTGDRDGAVVKPGRVLGRPRLIDVDREDSGVECAGH